MKKLFAVLAAGILAASLFAGCNNDDKKSEATETTAATTAATTAPATTAAATIDEPATSSASAEGIIGTWVTESYVDADGNFYSLEEYAAQFGVDVSTVNVTYIFADGGKVTSSYGGLSVDGTYTFDGTEIQTKFMAANVDFTYDAEEDIISSYDVNTGISTILVRAEQ